MDQGDSEMRTSLLQILSENSAGLSVIAAAADVIAADARFNLWLARGGKDQDCSRALDLLKYYEDVFQTCHSAIRSFHRDGDQIEFTRALEGVTSSLAKVTGTDGLSAVSLGL